MLATEQILHRMDDLYDQALTKPRDAMLKGELLGLAEALVAAYRIEIDDIREFMAERAEARQAGTQVPTLRRLADKRIRQPA